MKLDLKQENINSLNYFQRDLFLDEKNSIFVYDLEERMKKDQTYSLVRKLRNLDENYLYLSKEEQEVFDNNSYVYDDFLCNLLQLLDFSVVINLRMQYFLEYKKLPDLDELGQLSKWVRSSKSEFKKDNLFLDKQELEIFKTNFYKASKIKKEFHDAHIYIVMNIVWNYQFQSYSKDIIELSMNGKNILDKSINSFFFKLEKIEDEWTADDDIKHSSYVKSPKDLNFDECLYAQDFLDAYYDFLKITEKNIGENIARYLINNIELS